MCACDLSGTNTEKNSGRIHTKLVKGVTKTLELKGETMGVSVVILLYCTLIHASVPKPVVHRKAIGIVFWTIFAGKKIRSQICKLTM